MTTPTTEDTSHSPPTPHRTLPVRLSPPKRKRSLDRDPPPDEIPETPWRKSVATSNEGGSPHSKRLVGQMQGMKLDEDVVGEGDVEMESELPAQKRRRSLVMKGGSPMRVAGKAEVEGGTATEARSKRLRSPPPEGILATAEEEAANLLKQDDEDFEDDPEDFGIAYMPTPAQRDHRRQKRLQQIKDYKSRESKEARQKRSEHRRRRRSTSLYEQSQSARETSDENQAKKAVHFLV